MWLSRTANSAKASLLLSVLLYAALLALPLDGCTSPFGKVGVSWIMYGMACGFVLALLLAVRGWRRERRWALYAMALALISVLGISVPVLVDGMGMLRTPAAAAEVEMCPIRR